MKREKTYTSPQQAMSKAAEIIKQHAATIPGLRDDFAERLASALDHGYINIEWERSWGVGASLSVGFRHGRLEQEETRIIYHKRGDLSVGWSSTGRTPTEAMAAIALYTQVAQLACLLESVLGHLEIAEVQAIAPKAEEQAQ